jgi:hypothetical protein
MTYRRSEEIHEEFTAFLNSVAPTKDDVNSVTDQLIAAAADRAKSSRMLAQRHKVESQRLDDQQQRLIDMRMQNMITDGEFTIQRAMLAKRRSELRNHGAKALYDDESIKRQLDDIYEPLLRAADTWTTLSPVLKQRFQRFVFPAGFVAGRIGTAEMGRLFSTFRRPRGHASTVVPLEGQFWNQFVEEIQVFAAILRESSGREFPTQLVQR